MRVFRHSAGAVRLLQVTSFATFVIVFGEQQEASSLSSGVGLLHKHDHDASGMISKSDPSEGHVAPKEEAESEGHAAPKEEGESKSPEAETDVSAEKISIQGINKLKHMVEEEADDGEPKVVKTPAEKKAEKDAEEQRDPLDVAAEELFDKPDSSKGHESISEGEGDDEGEEAGAHAEGVEEGAHEEHAAHGAEEDADKEKHGVHPDQQEWHTDSENFGHGAPHGGGTTHGHPGGHSHSVSFKVHLLLMVVPVFVLSSVGYYFLISDIDIEVGSGKQMHDKLHPHAVGWRQRLGKIMEHPLTNGFILSFIGVDLCCAVVHDLIKETDLLNPMYDEWGKMMVHQSRLLSIYILCGFLVEQCLHILCFGKAFFYHFFYCMDLVTVYVSLLGETVLHNTFGDMVQFLIAMRLWKVVCIIFDVFLAKEEAGHMREKIKKNKAAIQKKRSARLSVSTSPQKSAANPVSSTSPQQSV